MIGGSWLVLGVDPAPRKQTVAFDGEGSATWHPTVVKQSLQTRIQAATAVGRPVLLLWDAPLHRDTDDFYSRRVDQDAQAMDGTCRPHCRARHPQGTVRSLRTAPSHGRAAVADLRRHRSGMAHLWPGDGAQSRGAWARHGEGPRWARARRAVALMSPIPWVPSQREPGHRPAPGLHRAPLAPPAAGDASDWYHGRVRRVS